MLRDCLKLEWLQVLFFYVDEFEFVFFGYELNWFDFHILV